MFLLSGGVPEEGAMGQGCFKEWGPALHSDFHLSVGVLSLEVLGSSDFLLCEFTPKEEERFSKSGNH